MQLSRPGRSTSHRHGRRKRDRQRDRGAVRGGRRLACSPATSMQRARRRRGRPADPRRAPASPTSRSRGRRGPHLRPGARASLGGLDVLVNNAGVGGPVACVEDVPPDEWRRTLDVNLTGAFLCTRRAAAAAQGAGLRLHHQHVVPLRLPRRPAAARPTSPASGRSSGSPRPSPWSSGRSASAPTRSAPAAWRASVWSGSSAWSPTSGASPASSSARTGSAAARCARSSPPDDVAAMILFLCSDQGARISGQAIGVDGHTEFI